MSKTRALKFSESSLIPNREKLCGQTYKSKACRVAAAAYATNLYRSDRLALIPGYAFMSGENWRESMEKAKRTERNDDEADPAVLALATDLYFNIHTWRTVDEGRAHLYAAKSNAEITMSRMPNMRQALASALEGMVIQAWTAFEVLAEDLHKRAIRMRPKLDTRSTWHGDKRGNSGYRSRGKVANYYRWTFPVDNADILAVVDNSAVHALAILRNSLVHCGGIIDPGFQDDRKGFFKGVVKDKKTDQRYPIPELQRIKGRAIGYKIPFSGEMIRSFIDPVTPLGFGLVKAVDEWLTTHK